MFSKLKISGKTFKGKVFYDANCNLCHRTIRFLERLDTADNLEFIPLQHSKFDSKELKAVIFEENNRIFSKSDAVIRIAKHLKGSVSWLYVFIIIPRFLRNWIYDIIANNRYRWFGKCDSCSITNFQNKKEVACNS